MRAALTMFVDPLNSYVQPYLALTQLLLNATQSEMDGISFPFRFISRKSGQLAIRAFRYTLLLSPAQRRQDGHFSGSSQARDIITLLVDRESYSHPNASYMARGILAANDTSPETPTQTAQSMRMRTAWIRLQLAGQVTLPILITTLLFYKRIARCNPTVINLCIVWTMATIPPELLFYTGRYNETPSTMLCLFQVSMISAMLPIHITLQGRNGISGSGGTCRYCPHLDRIQFLH
ncbi:hypothetical protein JB92DRAFT_3254619 [Gautieria morchelliformis]|nr:hypothetical protein JB92DRAFT_3254619 [Gautieria morchelliformis]